MLDLAELAAFDDRLCTARGRVKAVVECLKEHEALARREREHSTRLGGRVRARLLEQDVLACRERLHCPLVVQAVRQLRERARAFSANGG
jgi:hypothetical protein